MDELAIEPWRPRKRPLGQCSAAASMNLDYDVFLNHRGLDAKAGFMSHLDEALRAAGLNPFLDKASLRAGDHAFESIEAALEVAKVHVAVVSKGYAESKYCLNELVTIMKSGKPVIPVFYDVEPTDMRLVESGPFAEAFEKHKLKRREEQVEEWRDALRKLADIRGICFRLSDYKGDEAKLKWEVLDAILSMIPVIEELHVEEQLVGVKEHIRTCIDKLETMSSVPCMLGLVGMGGVGKTSLGKLIYNHLCRHKRFQGMSFLEIDRHSPSRMEVAQSLVSRLQGQLLWDLLQVPKNNQQGYKYWFNKLSRQCPFLVVLDDLYERSQFDAIILDRGLLAPGSCIIVTSRDEHLLKIIGGKSNFYLHKVPPLGYDDAQKLFNLHAFGSEKPPINFKDLAAGITNECGGLPLALKVVGSSLFDKRSDEDLECIWPEAVDALKRDPSVVNVLKWSYDCLPNVEKLMLVDIACIFHGWEKDEVLKIWESCKECTCCGISTPHTSLRNLIDKSLIVLEYEPQGKLIFSMHGLLRELDESIGISEGSHLWKGKARKAIEHRIQGLNNVRALNLANSGRREYESKNFAEMINLHFLVLDGCNIHDGLRSITEELRLLQWRYMPLTYIPCLSNLTNLTSLDLSESTMLASIWVESDSSLEACPNLLNLNLSGCTSITTLPDSIGHLSKLQVLNLEMCSNLQKIPISIGRLTALQNLFLFWCNRLEALPDTITAFSGLHCLNLMGCSSISNLPTTFGLMSCLTHLVVNLATEEQALAIAQLTMPLSILLVAYCTDEAICALDNLGAFINLHHLSRIYFYGCLSMTIFPKTIELLENLKTLSLYGCEKLQRLPDSVGELKVLKTLWLRECHSLETLPISLGALTCLQMLYIVKCISLTELPTSLGHLSSLRMLCIEGCLKLQRLPECVKNLDGLEYLTILDCSSLEGMGVVRTLQGLRIWGCTSIMELPGSCLIVLTNEYDSSIYSGMYLDIEEFYPIPRSLREIEVVEENDCGLLRLVQEAYHKRVILQRIHNVPCCKLSTV